MTEFKRDLVGDTLSDRLPLKVTNYGETIAVILSVKDYNQLVRQYKTNNQAVIQPIPYQRGVKYAPGTQVSHKGRVYTVPETDAEGYLVPEF